MTGTPVGILEQYWPPPNVDDHQNVKSMVQGFQELMKLEGKTGDDAAVEVSDGKRPALSRKVRNLQPLAMIARNWVFLFTENGASLEAHVINLAEMARTLFHLMRLPNTSAMPGQTYTAIMHAIHMHIQNIARCQQEGIDTYYLFLATTHMLEQLFGIARTLVGAQRNFDTLQFEERLSTIIAMFFIYLEFPSWKEHARRISAGFDHWNTRSWTGCTDPRKVNLVNAYATGFSISYDGLLKTGLYTAADLDIDAILAHDKTISLIHPKGSKEPLPINDADDGVEAAVGDAPSDITDAATENADAAPTPPSEPEPERADMDLDAASATAASTAAAPATAAPTTAAPTAPTTTEDVSQTQRTSFT